MKTSTEIGSSAAIVGEERAVELVAKAGFDAWDFSMWDMVRYDWSRKCAVKTTHPLAQDNYLAFAHKLKQIGLDNGIHCNQSHAPFPSAVPEIRDMLKRSIECTAEAGGKICIIHPCNDWSAEENADIYRELLPFAKQHDVKIATENMWNWDSQKKEALPAACSDPTSFNAHLDVINDPYFVACLDIGHAEMRGLNTCAVDMIYALGDRLQALHIHDNDQWHDSHQIPFSMNIDFNAIVAALKKIGYKGYFTLECGTYLEKSDKDTIGQLLKDMYAVVRRLADSFEK